MSLPRYRSPRIPDAPRAITKGVPLKNIISTESVGYLARNIALVSPSFPAKDFYQVGCEELAPLSLMDRGRHLARTLHTFLPSNYDTAIRLLIDSFPTATPSTEEFGLAGFFYLPYSFYIANYGVSAEHNNGNDPFDVSMQAQYELTQRFTAEFCIRPFLITHQARTLTLLTGWLDDPSNHVRRLCSEGTRPRLPWGINLPALINDPSPVMPLLDKLKNDDSLYVRRSVANHLGDIAKDHPERVFDLCRGWLKDTNKELNWVIRHALRYHAKKAHPEALAIRELAKP